MTRFLWRMGGALAAGALGLVLIFWQLEHVALRSYAGLGRPAVGVYALLFAGLLLVGGAARYAYTRWVAYLRDHPETRHVPAWLLIAIVVVAAVAFAAGTAVHGSYLDAQDPVPLTISQGYVAYETSFALLAAVALVLLTARRATRNR